MNPVLDASGPRLVAFDHEGRRIGIAIGSVIHDVTHEHTSVASAIGLSASELSKLAEAAPESLSSESVRLLAPIDDGARIFCLALNYRAHADESGGADPGRPVIFHKLDTSLVGPFEDIITPGFTDYLDYEAELGLVVGATARNVSRENWRDVVGGYTVLNDISCRDMQGTKLGEQTIVDWFSAKEADDTTPVGPWIVPADEVDDPQALRVTLQRNGDTLQDASTALMIFDIPTIIEYLTSRVTLRPGDLIATGTPGGVGKARGIRLEPGDIVEVEVAGVGRIANQVVATR